MNSTELSPGRNYKCITWRLKADVNREVILSDAALLFKERVSSPQRR